jgi:DinB family protein
MWTLAAEHAALCDLVEKGRAVFDAVHHRGQLTTCLRPMGGKVPSIYGPSGDEGPR